jgi:hypothetical protein
MTTGTTPSWKRCGVCKSDLGFEADYYECSVSTCTSGRSHPVFCSVTCWEQHVPVMRHRDAWAEQKKSPTRSAWDAMQATGGDAAPRRFVVDARTPARAAAPESNPADEVLVVASRLKAYVRARSGMNTSEAVLDELSQIVREHTDRAIERARADGRKTLMDRDFKGGDL